MNNNYLIAIGDELEHFEEIRDIVIEKSEELKNSLTGYELKIFCLNIRSIKKNFDDLMVQLQDISIVFDIIILTESWIKKDFVPKILKNYNVFKTVNNPLQNDGIVVYTRAALNVTCVELEIRQANVLHLMLQTDKHMYNILAIYRSPSHNDISDFLNDLRNFFNRMRNQTIICMGDTNINTLQPNQHRQLDEYFNLINEF